MFVRLKNWWHHRRIGQDIKALENEGSTGRTDETLNALNRQQTDTLSGQEIQELIRARTAEGKPVGKLISAARDRGIPIPTNLSDAGLKSAIKEREAQGHTGRTDSATHALNCAQTNRLSNSQVSFLIQSRRAAGLPTGKLEAAARDRGISDSSSDE
jgi:hypothetical protein